MTKRLCSKCGNPILKGRRSNFCYDCRPKIKPIEDQNCLNCGSLFHPNKRSMKYCSSECCSTHSRKSFCRVCGKFCLGRKFCELHRKTKTKNDDKNCKECGKLFHPKEKKVVFCSMKCYLSNKRTRPEKNCKECGKTFFPKKKVSLFCSVNCYLLNKKPKPKNPFTWIFKIRNETDVYKDDPMLPRPHPMIPTEEIRRGL